MTADQLTKAYAHGLALIARAAAEDLTTAGIPAVRLAAVGSVYEEAARADIGEPGSEPTA